MIKTNKRIVLHIVLQIDHENFTWNDRDEKIWSNRMLPNDLWKKVHGSSRANKQSRYVNFAFSRKQKHKSQRRKMPENVLTELASYMKFIFP